LGQRIADSKSTMEGDGHAALPHWNEAGLLSIVITTGVQVNAL